MCGMTKYKTLKEVRNAITDGELVIDHKTGDGFLDIDNDMSFIYVGGDCVFRAGGPKELIWEAMQLLGIKAVPA